MDLTSIYVDPLIIKAANGSNGVERVVGVAFSRRDFEGGAEACSIANGSRSCSYHPRCWGIEELEQIRIAPLVSPLFHSSPQRLCGGAPPIGEHTFQFCLTVAPLD